MKTNLLPVDRLLRVALGALLLAAPLFGVHIYPVNLIGLVLLGTAFAGYCPLYALVGRAARALKGSSKKPA